MNLWYTDGLTMDEFQEMRQRYARPSDPNFIPHSKIPNATTLMTNTRGIF